MGLMLELSVVIGAGPLHAAAPDKGVCGYVA